MHTHFRSSLFARRTVDFLGLATGALMPAAALSLAQGEDRSLPHFAVPGPTRKGMSGRIWTPPDCNRFLASYGSRSQLLTYIRRRYAA
jgi:hypothetical protein